MALRTERGREACGNVIRHVSTIRRRAVPRRLVAPVAIRVRRGERIVVVDVAVRAGVHLARRSQLVRPKQRPARRGVVEGRRQKRNRVVTIRAVRRRKGCSRCRVHRVGGALPASPVVCIQVALGVPAIGRLDLQVVVVVDVAVRAGSDFTRGRHLMRIGQREARGGMVKIRVQPRDRVVAIGTSCNRENRRRGGMLRIRRLLPRGEMATRMPAVCGGDLQVVVAADMATRARNIRVSVGEREVDGGSRMVYGSPEPTVERVARLAGGREVGSNVVWHAPT